MKLLRPIYDRDSYSKPIAKAIFAQLDELIFSPLQAILKGETLNAQETPLARALRTGKLQYVDNTFVGPLTATLTKELRGIGARYNKTKRAYTLEIAALPQNILMAISAGNIANKETLRRVEDFLRAIEGRKIQGPAIEKYFGDTLDSLSQQFHFSTRKVTGSELEIPLQKQFEDELKKAYTENLDIYIQKWHDEQVLRLRQKVSKNVNAGFRAENLIKDIMAERGTSYKHARFMAKQETSLMVSKYREIRYTNAGLQYYIWSSSHDARVRPRHRELDRESRSRPFRFDSPPVVDLTTMRRGNPGEDFGCRCVSIPILTREREFAYGQT
jgi:SPP1 gp7 family putative phage head morphogenesis protein